MTHPRRPCTAILRFPFLLGAGIAVLLISCALVSSHKIFWYDELVSHYLLADPSLFHMVRALTDYVDTAPPFYHIVGWFWVHLWDESANSLRLFSSLGMCLAYFTTWRLLNRTFGIRIASISTLLAFCLTTILLYQNAEARFYGLYMLFAALAALQYDSIGRYARQGNQPKGWRYWRMLLANAAIHGCLVLTHYVGFIISGMVLLAFVLRDLKAKQFKPFEYASIGLGWLAFLPWLPILLHQSTIAKTTIWIPPPTLSDLWGSYMSGISPLLVPLLLFLAIPLILLATKKKSPKSTPSVRTDDATLKAQMLRSTQIIGACLLALPVVIWIVSSVAIPVFTDRYMLPVVIGWSILLADILFRYQHYLSPAASGQMISSKRLIGWYRRVGWVCSVVVILVALLFPVLYGTYFPTDTIPSQTDASIGYTNLPIAVTDPDIYLKDFYYSSQVPAQSSNPASDTRYFFVLDWDAAQDKHSSGYAMSAYQLMAAFKRQYSDCLCGQHVVLLADFLAQYPDFLLANLPASAWPLIRLKDNPAYRWTDLGEKNGIPMVLVQKKPS